MLQPNSKCVAIIPISSVITNRGDGLTFKEQLLKHHTLEAVMSMPLELFHNSKVSVVTVVVVITAHQPHPSGKKTWFGYWRDDGFVKTKSKGRIDLNNQWASIKKKWINAFRNREVIPYFSIMREITPEDEWCAEAYLETDYSSLSQSDFEKELKKYAAHQILLGE
jgi:hypothetical protein